MYSLSVLLGFCFCAMLTLLIPFNVMRASSIEYRSWFRGSVYLLQSQHKIIIISNIMFEQRLRARALLQPQSNSSRRSYSPVCIDFFPFFQFFTHLPSFFFYQLASGYWSLLCLCTEGFSLTRWKHTLQLNEQYALRPWPMLELRTQRRGKATVNLNDEAYTKKKQPTKTWSTAWYALSLTVCALCAVCCCLLCAPECFLFFESVFHSSLFGGVKWREIWMRF